jgi:hypothetical protein
VRAENTLFIASLAVFWHNKFTHTFALAVGEFLIANGIAPGNPIYEKHKNLFKGVK